MSRNTAGALPKNSTAPLFQDLLQALAATNPDITFKASKEFYWSPRQRTIHYIAKDTTAACYALLHEAGHALLLHKNYRADFQLLDMEVAAWEEAKRQAPSFGLTIDEDHIQDCLDSYRDWLYRRSICPSCTTKALQLDGTPVYRCHNCHATWRVATSRFCRPYRQSQPVLRQPIVP